jgi:hypothetical protein
MNDNVDLVVVPLTSGRVPLYMAPVGLFDFNGALCVKTEYSTNGRPDAYIVGSGEYFWGGTSDPAVAARHMVTPLTVRHNAHSERAAIDATLQCDVGNPHQEV